MKEILKNDIDCLVIDLKDTSGGCTDIFKLKNSKMTISFLLRERIIMGDDFPIEAHSVIPDIQYDRSLEEYLESLN